ncbi:MAG: hypothetical protein ACXACB_14235 [Promethearchaeota archaeon]
MESSHSFLPAHHLVTTTPIINIMIGIKIAATTRAINAASN